jgi:hypothetical protein
MRLKVSKPKQTLCLISMDGWLIVLITCDDCMILLLVTIVCCVDLVVTNRDNINILFYIIMNIFDFISEIQVMEAIATAFGFTN